MPFFSIITINLNNLPGLQRTINSVKIQDFEDYEYILVDGGSSDASVDYAKSTGIFSNIISEPDNGIYHAMNKGLKNASGEYIIFLNSGDAFISPGILSLVYHSPHADLVYGDIEINYADRKVIQQHPDALNNKMFFFGTICHQAIFAARKLFDHTGGFNEHYKLCADYEWLIKVFRLNKATYHLNKIIVAYDGTGFSNRPETLQSVVAERHAIQEKFFRRSEIRYYRTMLQLNGIYTRRMNALMKMIYGR